MEQGRAEGNRLVCGGHRLTEGSLAEGFFMAPTILSDVQPGDALCREEIFGPVVAFSPFETEAEAIRMANDTIYGLSAAVFTEDMRAAYRVTRALRAGVLWVNNYHFTSVELPWGGFKQSGLGRTLGLHGLDCYLETKQINVHADDADFDWYSLGSP